MKSMNKYLLAICFMLFSFPLSALGYNVNFEFDAGFSECLLSQQIQESRNFWQDFGHFGDYINAGGVISADIVISQNLSFELGIQFKNTQLNYSVKDGNLIANGNVKINYPVIQLPLMVKYSFILKKTTSVISSLDLAGGVNISYIIGKQYYIDSVTTYMGNFISPVFNVGASVKAVFSHKIGPGKAFAGLRADMNFIPQNYTISSRKMNIGNILSFSPVLGYTFIIKEDKGLSKITEKNKRIKDISVE